jgi:hypothetical protein
MAVLTIREQNKPHYVPVSCKIDRLTASDYVTSGYLPTGLLAQRITEYDKHLSAFEFKGAQASGGIWINPVIIVKAVVEAEECTIHFDLQNQYNYGIHAEGVMIDSRILGEADVSRTLELPPTDLAGYASQKAMAKMGSPEVVDLGMSLGELGETLGFLRNPVKHLVKHATNHQHAASRLYKKRKKGVSQRMRSNFSWKAQVAADAIAESNLSYMYGYQTLMQDLDGMTTLATQQAVKISGRRRRAVGTATSKGEHVKNYVTPGPTMYVPGATVKCIYDKWTDHKAVSIMYYRYRPWMEDAISLSRVGLSPTQQLTTLFAVTRLSFVVDWALDVSTWLRAFEPKPQLEPLTGCSSMVTQYNVTMEPGVISVPDNYYGGRRLGLLQGGYTKVIVRKLTRGKFTPPLLVPHWHPELISVANKVAGLNLLWTNRPKILKRKLTFRDLDLYGDN